jgi:hypothetical protein
LNAGFEAINLDNLNDIILNENKHFLLGLIDPYMEYDFPDEDFCYFSSYPHNKLLFTYIKTKDKLECSCTLVWLNLYTKYSKYKNQILSSSSWVYDCVANEDIFNKKIQECNFPDRVLNCSGQLTTKTTTTTTTTTILTTIPKNNTILLVSTLVPSLLLLLAICAILGGYFYYKKIYLVKKQNKIEDEINSRNRVGIENTDHVFEMVLKYPKDELIDHSSKLESIKSLIRSYENEDLFMKNEYDFGLCEELYHSIQLKEYNTAIAHSKTMIIPLNDQSVSNGLLNKKDKKFVDKQLDAMIEKKLIKQVKKIEKDENFISSKWLAQIIFCKLTKTFFVDFRKLNAHIEQSFIRYQQNFAEKILEKLKKARVFSTINLDSASYQIPLEPKSKYKTLFATHRGLFQFEVMPRELKYKFQTFEKLFSILFEKCEAFCFLHVDSLLVFSENSQTHLNHLSLVFELLKTHNFKIDLEKCRFEKYELKYFMNTIEDGRITFNSDTLEAIDRIKTPHDKESLTKFLFFIDAFKPFIKNHEKMVRYFRNKLRLTNKKITWSPSCDTKFANLKSALKKCLSINLEQYLSNDNNNNNEQSKSLILHTYYKNNEFNCVLVHFDNNTGLEFPIAFCRKPFMNNGFSFFSSNLNNLKIKCLVWAIEHFKPILHDRNFFISIKIFDKANDFTNDKFTNEHFKILVNQLQNYRFEITDKNSVSDLEQILSDI